MFEYDYGLLRWLSGKESACQCRRSKRLGFDPWIGKIPWKWKPLQYSCLGNPMDRGSWQATLSRVRHNWTHTHCIQTRIWGFACSSSHSRSLLGSEPFLYSQIIIMEQGLYMGKHCPALCISGWWVCWALGVGSQEAHSRHLVNYLLQNQPHW